MLKPRAQHVCVQSIEPLSRRHPNRDVCASGGYYVAAAADAIYVNESSVIGSIGVLMNGFGFVDAMKKVGVERRLLTAGANKAMFDPFSPENPKQVAYLQDMLDHIHQQFIDAVKKGRGDRLKVSPQLFSGLVYTGDQAVSNGLVDGLGSVRSVIHDQFKLKHRIDMTPKRGVLHELLGQSASTLAGAMSHAIDTLWTDSSGPKLYP